MKKRPIVYLITAALLTLTVSGCGSEKTEKQTKQPTEKEPTKVILNEVAHSIFYAPMYAAIENGYFEDEGLDITLNTGFGADKTMTAVLSGEADIGFMGIRSFHLHLQRRGKGLCRQLCTADTARRQLPCRPGRNAGFLMG